MTAAPKPPLFVGRDWLFSKVDEWLAQENTFRVFVITGPPGTGKSAIAARLQAFNSGEVAAPASLRNLPAGFLSAQHVCTRRRADTLDPHTFVESIASQLAARYPAYATALTARPFAVSTTIVRATASAEQNFGVVAAVKHLTVNAPSAADAFSIAVRLPLTTVACDAATPRPIVLLIDALDEAKSSQYAVSIGGLVTAPDALPPGVRLILTMRSEPDLLQPLMRWLPPPRIISLMSPACAGESYGDITAYVKLRLERDSKLCQRIESAVPIGRFISDVVERSNFLYAQLLLDMLEKSEAEFEADYLAKLPRTLDEFYADYIHRVAESSLQWRKAFAPVLAAVAVAEAPLSELQIARFSHVRERDVWHALAQASNLLIIAEGVVRTYELFHQSFAQYLFDSATDVAYRCSAIDAHAGIIEFYRDNRELWNGVDWALVDDYGLRFLPAHIIAAAPDASAELTSLLAPAFLREKWKRFGSERSILADIRSAAAAALDANDLVAIFRWTAIDLGIRDQADVLATPELLPYYARTGRDDRAIELLDVAASDGAIDVGSLGSMLSTLGEHGMLATGEAVVARFRSESERVAARWNLAIGAARTDPAAGLAIAPKTISPQIPEFCRILAERDAYVDDAISIADGDSPALDAIACTVAWRDPQRAIAIADAMRPYVYRVAGQDVRRTGQAVRAHIVTIVSRRDPLQALEIFKTIAAREEAHPAAAILAGALAERDLSTALALTVRFAWDSAHKYRFVDRGLEYCEWFDLSLAFVFAHILARVRAPNQRKAIDEAWRRFRPRTSALGFDFTTLAAFDLESLRADDDAREIVRDCFRLLDPEVLDDLKDIKAAGHAVEAFAAAMTPFDADRAIDFVRRAQKMLPSHTILGRGLVAVAEALARYDPDRAIALAREIEGYYSHCAHVGVAREIARFDLDKALELLDGIAREFVKSRAAVLGAISSQIDLTDASIATKISSRLPRHADSAWMMDRIGAAIEGERSGKALDFSHVDRLTREEWPREGDEHENGERAMPDRLPRAEILAALQAADFSAAVRLISSFPAEPGTSTWAEKGRATAFVAGRIAAEDPLRALAAARAIENRDGRSNALVRILAALGRNNVSALYSLFDAIRTVEPAFSRREVYMAAFAALRRLQAGTHPVGKLVSDLASLQHEEWIELLPHAVKTICATDPSALDRFSNEVTRISQLLDL